MHVNVQKSTATTLPRNASTVSGSVFNHAFAPSNDAMWLFTGSCSCEKSSFTFMVTPHD